MDKITPPRSAGILQVHSMPIPSHRSHKSVPPPVSKIRNAINGDHKGNGHGRATSFNMTHSNNLEKTFRFIQSSKHENLGLVLGKGGFIKSIDRESLADRHGVKAGWIITSVNNEKAKVSASDIQKQIKKARKLDIFILKFVDTKDFPGGDEPRLRSKSEQRSRTRNKNSKSWGRVRRSFSRSRSTKNVFEYDPNRLLSGSTPPLQSPAIRIGSPQQQEKKSARRALSPRRAIAISLYQDALEDPEEEKLRSAKTFQKNICLLKSGVHLFRVLKNGGIRKCTFLELY
eukprot:TRINITY_DN4464_c0_g1_i1.p1 TRINITY_DN4464_c0_g1~~TRINITY_DN4464_c0_g1_i1.p1  ORF type:complete len:287 (+),score=30.87 TRINITY_DN4464_c0_g1_i1:209-1069(+)